MQRGGAYNNNAHRARADYRNNNNPNNRNDNNGFRVVGVSVHVLHMQGANSIRPSLWAPGFPVRGAVPPYTAPPGNVR